MLSVYFLMSKQDFAKEEAQSNKYTTAKPNVKTHRESKGLIS